MKDLARYRGFLLGLAVGDALGTTVEFQPRSTFPPVTSMVGGGVFNLKPAQWTDDTSMALCLAESLVNIEKAAQLFDDKTAIRGNFDPVTVMLQGTEATVMAATRDCIQKGGKRLFSGAGCEIQDGTPKDNLLAQYQALCG